MSDETLPGEVWWVDFDIGVGSKPDGIRPAIVIQVDWLRGLRTVVVVPLSSNLALRRHPTTVFLPGSETGLPHDSLAMCHQIGAIDRSMLRRDGPVGCVTERLLATIRLRVADVVGIDVETFLNAE